MSDDEDTPIPPAIISCPDALAAGLKRYFTGKPCKHGHLAERWTSGWACVECTRVSSSDPEWRRAFNERRNAERRAVTAARGPKPRAAAKAAGLPRYFTGKPCKRGHTAERLVATKQCVECRLLRFEGSNIKREARKAYQAAWRQKNAEKRRERQRAYQAAVRSTEEGRRRCHEMTARWRVNNPDAVKEYASAYKEANRERMRKYRMDRWRDPQTRVHLQAIARATTEKNREKIAAKSRAWREANKDRRKEASRVWREANRERRAAHQRNRLARKAAAGGTHTAEDVQRIYQAQKGKCACCRVKVGDKYEVDHIQALSKGGSNWPSNLQILCPTCNARKHNLDPIEFMQRQGFLL